MKERRLLALLLLGIIGLVQGFTAARGLATASASVPRAARSRRGSTVFAMMRVPLPSLQQVCKRRQESINPSFLFRAGMQLTSCSSSFPRAGVLRRFALHVRQVARLVDACICVSWRGANPTEKTGKGLVADALSGSFDRPVALDVFIFIVSALFLKQTLAKVDYSKLDGLENNSLARDAGAWALAGEVPVISKDGRFEVATFAGGCFWGTELHFQRMPGVIATCVGYTQGEVETPTYQQVCSGSTGHTEGIQLIYDPSLCSYEELCGKLLSTVDPTALNRVGNDRGIPSLNVTPPHMLPPHYCTHFPHAHADGHHVHALLAGTQYRHGIYPHTEAQAETALRAIEMEQAKFSRPVVTEVGWRSALLTCQTSNLM